MAKTVTIQSGQTLADICVQELGDVTQMFEVARLNQIQVSATLVAGNTIKVPEPSLVSAAIRLLFKINKPASYSGVEQTELEGVGYWAIGINNVVQ